MSHLDRKTKLLVVDDDPSILRILEHVLNKQFGDQIITEAFADPAAAKNRLDAGDIEILVSDLDMPEIDGLDLLKYAKKRNARTQVLLLTGSSSTAALLDALELGANDYMLKPLDHDELIDLVQQANSRLVRWQRALATTWKQRKAAAASV